MPDCVEFQQVTKRYGTSVAVDAVDLRIGVGESVAIVGPSGAGKSTMLRLINTTVAHDAGTVRVLGAGVDNLGGRELVALRRAIATMYQDLHLVGELRVIHNVNAGHLAQWGTWQAMRSLVRPAALEQARCALARVGLEDALWRRTDELSGGERQRVALARLIVAEPALIVADEPTSNLDPARAGDVLALLVSLANASTSVVASVHAFDLARQHFDRLIGLRNGRVLFDLPAGEVTDLHGSVLYDLSTIVP